MCFSITTPGTLTCNPGINSLLDTKSEDDAGTEDEYELLVVQKREC